MRWRLYEPAPNSLKELPTERRQEIVQAVRKGRAVERPEDAETAVETGEWMVSQLRMTYPKLLATPLSVGAMVLLAMIGYAQAGDIRGSLINLVPFLAFLLIVRLIGRTLFRRAPQGLDANRELLERSRR
ncbi:MAG: hypothetical protein KY437_05195 [Actinobacteria bacterium]|nr:hypothetical protein [Actinomycetota bacterium]